MTTPASPPQKSPSPQKLKLGGIKIFCTLATATALGAILISVMLYQSIDQQADRLNATVDMLTQQQSSTEARLQAHQAVALRHHENTQRTTQKLEQQIQTVLSQCQHVSDDWRLYKARYLLELAQANSHWSSDNASTIAMLQTADTILAPIHNSKLLPVREALAQEIHEQKRAQKDAAMGTHANTTTLLVKLNAIENSTWSLSAIPLPTEAPTTKDSTPPEKNTLKTLKTRIQNTLSHIVTIQYHEDALSPTPTLAYESMIRATVRLNIEEAKWAVLERNTTIYQQAIEQAIFYLNKTFSPDTAATQTVISELEALAKISLSDERIVPEDALTKLSEVIDASHDAVGGMHD